MEIPEGLQDFDPDATGGMVLELRKSLYGLRQSAFLWHRKITTFSKKIGFSPITADASVLISSRSIMIALYVDDIVIFGNETQEIERVKEELKAFHPMTDTGLIDKLLGIQFTWLDGSIRLDQEIYASQILDEFEMTDCKPEPWPTSSVNLHQPDTDKRLGREDHKLFRRLIGRLTFLVVATRPDIAFPVNQLSIYLAEPCKIHLEAAKRILRYLKATIDYGLTYGAKGRQREGLVGYVDSAYANTAKGKSTTGFVFMIEGTPITWGSKKQAVTAQNSTEAE